MHVEKQCITAQVESFSEEVFHEFTTSFARTTTCCNCGGAGHYCNDCVVAYCFRCGNGWTNRQVSEYHHNSNCPWVLPSVSMNRKRTVSGPPNVVPYRQQQPVHPQYRTPGGRGATPSSNNAGRVNSGQHRPFHQGQPSFRGRGASGAVRG